MRVALYTFGCKLNQYETEALAAAFRGAGHAVSDIHGSSDLYIVSTCTVTSKSEQKARRLIRALSRQEDKPVVIVTGCYAQTDAAAVERLGPNVVCLPQDRKHALLELPAHVGGTAWRDAGSELAAYVRTTLARAAPPRGEAAFAYSMPQTTFHARAYLKIQDGCDYRCAYCRVPLARGPSVSRDAGEVLAEALALEGAGYRELVVTGVNIASYAGSGGGLAELLGTLLAGARLSRIRLSSLEPERLRGGLLDVIGHERICPHFHLPVQSLSDRVLGAMGRRYLSADVRAAAAALRARRDDPFIAADVIAGFPGESAADHEATVATIREIGFSQLHVFPFSPRPGTAAWGTGPRTPERVRDERAGELRAISAALHREYADRWMGRQVEVLVEEPGRGTSGNYLKVRLEPPLAQRGEVVSVVLGRVGGRIEGISPTRGLRNCSA